MNIKEKATALKEIINDATNQLWILRTSCPHPEGTYTYGAAGGDYDPSDDCYWRVYNCHHCDKTWTEYGTLGRGVKNPAYYSAPEGNWREAR